MSDGWQRKTSATDLLNTVRGQYAIATQEADAAIRTYIANHTPSQRQFHAIDLQIQIYRYRDAN